MKVSSDGKEETASRFLEKSGYAQRRLMDAVRFLPLMGMFLWGLPVLWREGSTTSAAAMLYLFGVWIALILASAFLTWRMARAERQRDAATSIEGGAELSPAIEDTEGPYSSGNPEARD